ncbi:hypothetical protein ACSBR1_036447 [Camellia fascicularis]
MAKITMKVIMTRYKDGFWGVGVMVDMRGGIGAAMCEIVKSIPSADAVFMKWIMYDWNNEDCVNILKNCQKVIPEKTGKVRRVAAMKIMDDGFEEKGKARKEQKLKTLTFGGGQGEVSVHR